MNIPPYTDLGENETGPGHDAGSLTWGTSSDPAVKAVETAVQALLTTPQVEIALGLVVLDLVRAEALSAGGLARLGINPNDLLGVAVAFAQADSPWTLLERLNVEAAKRRLLSDLGYLAASCGIDPATAQFDLFVDVVTKFANEHNLNDMRTALARLWREQPDRLEELLQSEA